MGEDVTVEACAHVGETSPVDAFIAFMSADSYDGIALPAVFQNICEKKRGNYHILELSHDWNVFYDQTLHRSAITCV